jgi:hypothetical protein
MRRGECPLCQRALARQREEEAEVVKRQALRALGALVAVACVWLFLTRERTPQDPRLDPEPYRAEIQALESVLYGTGRLGSDARGQLSEAARGLEITLRKGTRLNPKAGEALAMTVFQLGTLAELEGDSFDWAAHRQEWEAARAAHLRPAPWFAASSAALEEAQATGEARGIVPDAAPYERALDEIERLIARADADLSILPEDFGEMLDPMVSDRWDNGQKSAKADAEKIRADLPAPPPGAHSAWMRTWKAIDQCLRMIPSELFRTTGGEFGLPTRSQVQLRVAAARRRLAAARKTLAEAPR